MSPSSLGGVLIRGEGRYQRLQQVIDLGLQHKLSLSTVFCSPDSAYQARLSKVTAAEARLSKVTAAAMVVKKQS
jgi:hypothetical protein